MHGLRQLSAAAMEAGAISAKHKEPMALALGIGARCEGCIGFHAKALALMGATRAEVEKSVAVAAYVVGGPAQTVGASALDADGLTRSLTGTSVRLCPLATHRQAATVTKTAVAVNCLQSLQIALELTAKITLDQQATCRDRLNDLVELLRAEILCTDIRADVCLFQDPLGRARADPVNVRQRSFDPLIAGNIYSKESWHMFRSL